MKIWNLVSRFASLLLLLMAVFLALQDGMKIDWWNIREILCICIVSSLYVTICYSARVSAWAGVFSALLFGLWMESACRSQLVQEMQRIYSHVIPLVNQYYRTDFDGGEVVAVSDSRFLLVFLALFFGLWIGVGVASPRWRPLLWVVLAPAFFSGLFLGYTPGIGAAACLVGGLGMMLLISEKGESRQRIQARSLCAGVLLLLCLFLAVLLEPVSNFLLSYHKPLKAYQLSLEDKVLEVMEDSQFWNSFWWRMGGYQKTAVLSNVPPGLTEEVVLELTTDHLPAAPIYLKNFTGSVYDEGVWSDPTEEAFASFAEEAGSSGEEYGRKILTWGYEQQKEKGIQPDQITIRIRKHTGSFSPLPYGSDLPNDAEVIGDSGIRVSGDRYHFEGFLDFSKDTSDQISITAEDHNMQQPVPLDEAYGIFASKTYTKIPEDQLKRLLSQKEQALELLRRSRYSFDLKPVPQGEDLVEYFIFEQQKGYCMHFASAYVLLSRGYGTPARYAGGYLVLPQDFVKQQDGTYTAQVTQKRAHAWLEGYSQATGWRPVEVTPGSYYDSLLSASGTEDVAEIVADLEQEEGQEEVPKEDEEDTAKKEEPQQEEPNQTPQEEQETQQKEAASLGETESGTGINEGKEAEIGIPRWFLAAAISVVGAVILIGLILLRVKYTKEKRIRRMTEQNPNQGGAKAAEEVFWLLELAGVPYREGEDELEYARNVEEKLSCFAKGEFVSFVETVQVLRYAGTDLTPKQQTYLLKVYQKLLAEISLQMNVWQKLWYTYVLARI